MLKQLIQFVFLAIILFNAVQSELYAQSVSEPDNIMIFAVPNRPSVSEFRIRGRIQSQFANSFGNNGDDLINAGNYSSLEMRRVRLGVQGKIYDDWNFMVEANVLSGVDLDAATLSYTAIPLANITLGKAKPRFGHEQNTSSASILTFERTLLDGHLNGGKPIGLRIHGSANMFSYYLGVYNGQSVNTSRMDSELDSYLYNASIGLSLGRFIVDGLRVDIRTDYLYNAEESGYYNFEHAYAFSGHFGVGDLDLRAEYMTGQRFDDNKLNGFYIMPSYYVVPERFQAVVRYENVTSDSEIGLGHNRYADRVPNLLNSGNKYGAIYTGLNYYIHGDNLKLMLGFELAENSNDTSIPEGKVATIFSGFRMQF